MRTSKPMRIHRYLSIFPDNIYVYPNFVHIFVTGMLHCVPCAMYALELRAVQLHF